MSQSYTNQVIGVISTHSKISQNQHKFYKSSMDLLGLLLWFQKKSDACFASTKWLAEKLSVSERAILKTLKLLEEAGFILRSKEGRRRIIICLIDRLPKPKTKPKSTHINRQKVRIFNSLYIEQKLHNTNPEIDVVVDALKKEGIKPSVCHSLAKKYSRQRIREVINACRKQSDVKNKAGFIVQGLKSEWEFQGVRIEESPRYKTFVRPKELPDRSGYKQGVQMLREKIGLLNR